VIEERKAKQVKTDDVDLSQLLVTGNVDQSGIHLTTHYQGHPVHYLLLATHEFTQWQTLNIHQKTELIRARINAENFGNNPEIITAVVHATIQTIGKLLPIAQRDRALRARNKII
jgi:hypothetical protein